MNYFVNQYLMAMNSGLEHAEFKRLRVFHDHGAAAQLVTRNFDGLLHDNMKKFGLVDDDMVNLFDFFRGTEHFEPTVMTVDTLNLPRDYNINPGADDTKVYDGDRLVADVFFAPGTVGHLYYVLIYDAFGNITQRTDYDARGFKARDQFFGSDSHLSTELFYRPDGSRFMEQYYGPSAGTQGVLTQCKLMVDGDHYFNDEVALTTYFLDRLNERTPEENVFIADRPMVTDEPLVNMTTPARKYLWLPTPHTVDLTDQVFANLNGVYTYAIHEHMAAFDGVITATRRQAQDLTRWLGDHPARPITPISAAVAFADDLMAEPVPVAERTAGRLIVVSRLEPDKQVDQAIAAFSLIHKRLPKTTLTIYGYGSAQQTLQQQVDQLNLGDVVTFAGYQAAMDAVYDDAQVLINTARGDAQPLAMMEALTHGVPVVSYDSLYGPREMITDGQNGVLVQPGNVQKVADSVVSLLNSRKRLSRWSKQAVQLAKPFSDTNVWNAWDELLH
ncbi:glycosyltransferase [Furfurilactobacillus sp. WILCCON 0119]